MSETSKMNDCCFCVGNNWFRYRVAAVIISNGHVLFSHGDKSGYYYTVGGGVHIGERSDEAIIREVSEETGELFEIERPLCLIENFFKGEDALENLDCHTVEYYYLMKPSEKKEYDIVSTTAYGEREKMCWLPVAELDKYDIRPKILKKIIQNLPEHFKSYINDCN